MLPLKWEMLHLKVKAMGDTASSLSAGPAQRGPARPSLREDHEQPDHPQWPAHGERLSEDSLLFSWMFHPKKVDAKRKTNAGASSPTETLSVLRQLFSP